MLDKAVYQRLAGFSGVAALAGPRIYPGRAPANVAAPYIVFHVQGALDMAPDLDGASDLKSTRVQVDAWAADRTVANLLGDAIAAALGDFSGVAGGVAIADVTSEGGFDDDYDDPPPILYRRTRDFRISFYQQED